MILAPVFLLFGYALGTFGAIGAGEPLLNNRETLFVALAQVAGFVLLLFRLTGDLRGTL